MVSDAVLAAPGVDAYLAAVGLRAQPVDADHAVLEAAGLAAYRLSAAAPRDTLQ